MPRGRPTRSEIRQNMVEILAVKGEAYGYELANRKEYIESKEGTFESTLFELDLGLYHDIEPPQKIIKPNNSIYIVSPSKMPNDTETSYLEDLMQVLDLPDRPVFNPKKQISEELAGVDYYKAARKAMQQAGQFRVYWACNVATDNFFEIGMAYMAERTGKPITLINDIPQTDGGKSFNNLLRALHDQYKKSSLTK